VDRRRYGATKASGFKESSKRRLMTGLISVTASIFRNILLAQVSVWE
jgi:hypothetical protein